MSSAAGSGEAVWLHGAGLSAETWAGRAGGRCLNLPGHGGMPRAAEPTAAGFADRLMPLLPEGRFALVGHSLGAMVALEIAARRAEDIRALVLAETAYTMQARWIDRKGAGLAVGLTRWLGPKGVARLAGMGQSRAVRRALKTQTATMAPEALTDAMAAAHSFDGRGLLDRLTMPVLILTGRRNPRTLPQARDLSKRLPDARLMVLEGGHMLHADAPDAFYGTIGTFLKAHP
ncbi:MAG: alpha/beta hydrolase [Rhodobacteraceae bacterium]|nr:alpha/beta hydrolase [Paracoccaceae bacterium]